ncbi:MAG: AAA family ATPase [Candidatus Hodarchaeales archaeon]
MIGWKYLELTPGDLFSVEQGMIVHRINTVFERLYHLEKTVVFVDEIDFLVMNRKESKAENKKGVTGGSKIFSMYVTTLLPRLQDLTRSKKIILFLATNHLGNVDEAIYREGRMDIVLPIGNVSAYYRLALLYEHYKNPLYSLSKVPEELPKEQLKEQDKHTDEEIALAKFLKSTKFLPPDRIIHYSLAIIFGYLLHTIFTHLIQAKFPDQAINTYLL